jgi:hypothetical protein
MKALVLAAFLPAVLGGSDDYFAVDGAYQTPALPRVPGGSLVCSCNVPSMPGSHYRPDVLKYPNGPLPDLKVAMLISGEQSESTLLQLADLNSADEVIANLKTPAGGYGPQGLEWLPRTNVSVSKRTTYLHKTRCASGKQGQQVTTSSSIYKKCPGDGAGLQVVLTFQLPPYLCQQTCDKKSDCEAYTVDAIGQNCWILNGDDGEDQGGYLVYWRVGRSEPPRQMRAASLLQAPTNSKVLEVMAQNTANASSNTYFAIDGAHFEEDYENFVGTCNVPSNGTRPYWPDLPVFPSGPYNNLKSQMKLLGANIPESTILQIADVNSADMALAGLAPSDPEGGGPQSLEWLPRTNASVSKRTTYLHTTRCAGGAQGQQVKTSSSIYKKCLNGDTPLLNVALTFQLPPSLCQHTCDKKSDCEAYTVDAIGQNCWILTGNNNGQSNYGLYWRVG